MIEYDPPVHLVDSTRSHANSLRRGVATGQPRIPRLPSMEGLDHSSNLVEYQSSSSQDTLLAPAPSTDNTQGTSLNHTNSKPSALSPPQKHEQMMDLFQLHGIHTSTRISHSANVRPHKTETGSYYGSLEQVSLPHISAGLGQDCNLTSPTVSSPMRMSWTQRLYSLPWPVLSERGDTSCFRVIALVLCLAAQVMYVPYINVYHHPSATIPLTADLSVDAVFLLNNFAQSDNGSRTARGSPIRSRFELWRHYKPHGFVQDVLASLPFELLVINGDCDASSRWFVRLFQIALRYICVRRHLDDCRFLWTKRGERIIAWVPYARFSHLVRIVDTICMVALISHYLACWWTFLQVEAASHELVDPFQVHMQSLYDALLQFTRNALGMVQTATHSVGIFLGTLVLAVVFAHVTDIYNVHANSTIRQHTMRRTFELHGPSENEYINTTGSCTPSMGQTMVKSRSLRKS